MFATFEQRGKVWLAAHRCYPLLLLMLLLLQTLALAALLLGRQNLMQGQRNRFLTDIQLDEMGFGVDATV